jgi:D-cysteine desulfhydrase
MHLSRFPRQRFAHLPTPLEPMERLSKHLGGPRLWIKRDDCTGLSSGGNKTRKLEFLVADALARGADTLITCGGVQSNHCRLTLSAAAKEGLACRLVLAESAPGAYRPDGNGNVLLYHLLGAERITTVPWGSDLQAALAQAGAAAEAEGRRPCLIPLGGSNPLGALGYVACALELLEQFRETGLECQHLVVPVGSAGTLAGLLLGLRAGGSGIPVTGVTVLQPRSGAEATALNLIRATEAFLGCAAVVPAGDVTCMDDYLGDGYTLPTPGMVEAVQLVARFEAILLDPTYTGKAMAGLFDLARTGGFKKGDNVLFLHTGGSPGLFARPELFL